MRSPVENFSFTIEIKTRSCLGLCEKNESISYTALLELNHVFMVMPCIGKPQVHISWKMDSYVSGTIGNLCHNEFASHNLFTAHAAFNSVWDKYLD